MRPRGRHLLRTLWFAVLTFGPVSDDYLERRFQEWYRTKPSTLRAARKKLSDAGIIRCCGRTHEQRSRRLWKVER